MSSVALRVNLASGSNLSSWQNCWTSSGALQGCIITTSPAANLHSNHTTNEWILYEYYSDFRGRYKMYLSLSLSMVHHVLQQPLRQCNSTLMLGWKWYRKVTGPMLNCCTIHMKRTYSMLDPVMSNSMCLTSWKCDTSVTLLLDTSLAGKGWDWEGTVWSMGILSRSSVFSFASCRKWNVYVGGSLPQ